MLCRSTISTHRKSASAPWLLEAPACVLRARLVGLWSVSGVRGAALTVVQNGGGRLVGTGVYHNMQRLSSPTSHAHAITHRYMGATVMAVAGSVAVESHGRQLGWHVRHHAVRSV